MTSNYHLPTVENEDGSEGVITPPSQGQIIATYNPVVEVVLDSQKVVPFTNTMLPPAIHSPSVPQGLGINSEPTSLRDRQNMLASPTTQQSNQPFSQSPNLRQGNPPSLPSGTPTNVTPSYLHNPFVGVPPGSAVAGLQARLQGLQIELYLKGGLEPRKREALKAMSANAKRAK